MNKIVFSSLIAVNGMLTSYCNNLLTHHYYLTYVPSLFRHAILLRPDHETIFSRCCHVFKKKAEAIELPFCVKESGKKKEIVLASTRIGLTNLPLATKGLIIHSTSSRLLCRAIAVAVILWLYSSVLII